MIKLIKVLSWLFASGSVILIAGIFFIYAILVPKLPSIENLEHTQLQVPLRVYDQNEILLAEYGEHRRIPIDFQEIPDNLVSALVSVEDDQYWDHFGVDPLALMAAVYELASTGNKSRGGSTITMQVARNFFLSPEKSYTRKLNEILLALKIEARLSKEKILELYFNQVYLGKRAYGVVAAAQIYYDKTLDELSLAQAAMLAGLPKAPSKYNPIRNPERALSRRNHVLGRMLELGYIDEETFDIARIEPVTAELHATRTVADAQYVAELIRAKLVSEYGDDAYKTGIKAYSSIDGQLQKAANSALRHALMDYNRRHGYRGVIKSVDLSLIEDDPFDAGLVSDEQVGNLQQAVVTEVADTSATALITNYEYIQIPFKQGLDWAASYIGVDRFGKAPSKASDVLKVGDVIWVEQRDDLWLLADIPKVEGALVSLDSSNGAIRTMVGGFDFFKNKFNRVTQAKRQPGSNFKPFIYSAALEKGFTAASLINDAPVVFDDDSLEATWRPENYSGKVYGPTRLREALVKSRNLVSIRILQSIGLRYATKYVKNFGFKKKNLPYDLSLSLGSGTFAPLEIARAYTAFSNSGYLVEPYYLDRVESGTGETIFRHNPLMACHACQKSEPSDVQKNEFIPVYDERITETEEALPTLYAPRILSAQNAYIMRSIMYEVVKRGTAVRAKALGRSDIGGKTGTTNDQVDAWFSGFNDKVVTTSWVGFDNQQTLGRRETGGRAALPMWIEYMRVALKDVPDVIREQPEGLVTTRIDAETGKRASLDTVKSLFEIFRTENAPEEHRIVQSSNGDGSDSLTENGSKTEEEIVEEIF